MPRKPSRARGLGVSTEDYERMLAAQGGGCAICGAKPKSRRLHVDHDHRTGTVRGLLCFQHNRAIPYYMTGQLALDIHAYIVTHERRQGPLC
jgi:hypothetical protein